MAYKDLTFLLFAKDMNVKESFNGVSRSADGMSAGVKGALAGMGVAVAGAAVAYAAHSISMAASFQSATTRLVTDAGESASTMGKLSDGLLSISTDTGTSADEIAKGMYKVSSAGYTMAHGGLQVMKAAAEGAKVGGADLSTVADALTTVMKDYGIGAGKATNTTSELIATVSRGKTTMEDLAGSLHSVLPNAQALGISLNDVLGALATMTQEGISADQATQNLNHTIVSIANPTHQMSLEMAAMGLNSTKVAANLGRRGITGTLDDLVTAITKHMGPAGLVLQKSFTNSTLAAQSAATMYRALPGPVKTVAAAYLAGSISQKTWTTAVKAMTPAQANLAKQWAATENASKGFSQQLKSGSGAAQTFTAALAKMTGGQTGLQVALHITGIHADDTAASVKAIGEAAQGTQKHVSDWDKTQATFNQQMSEAKASVDRLGISVGQELMPGLEKIVTVVPGVVDWLVNAQGAIKGFDIQVLQSVKSVINWTGSLEQAGQHAIEGLVQGIESGAKDVQGAVNWIAGLIPSGVRKFLQINSPSRVMIPIGSGVGEGLSVGILGSANQVQSASSKLSTMVVGMFDKGTIGAGTESRALATIRSGTNALIAEATRRATVGKQLAAAEKTLTKDLAAQRKLRDSTVIGSTVQAGDVTQFASAGDMVGGLSGLVARTNRFRADLTQLAKKGIDQDTFRQLIAAGVDGGGLQAADQLLANPSDFKQIVALQRQLAASAGSLGSLAGNYEYAPTLARDRARVATLKGAQQVETWRMQKTAAGMLNAIARETHVHIHLAGTFVGTKDELAKTVTQAIRDAVKRGQLPKNVLTAL